MAHRYPPGPKDWLLGYRLVRRIRRDSLGFYTSIQRQYGDIVYMRLGPYRDYTVFHPDLIREVLVTKAKYFQKMAWQVRVFRQWNGNSIIVSEGDFWLRQRRLVQRAFLPKRLAGYGKQMVAGTERMIADWQRAIDASGRCEIDAVNTMTDLTIAIIAKTMFGAEVFDKTRQMGEAVSVLNDVAMYEMMHPFKLPDWLPFRWQRRKRWAMRFLDETIWGFIRERRATGEDRGDVLSMLLLAVDEEGAGGGMTDEQVRNEAMTLLLAGHDTTAAGLAWVWYVLARHPEVESRVVAEMEQVLGGRRPTAEDVPRLRYLDMVLKETLRLYPPAIGVFGREAVADVTIGDYLVKKGSLVHVLSYPVHRDPRWFPDPEKFDPERFALERAEKLPPFAYFPFGGGPRVCIGNNFAMLEMALIVATVLQRFQLALAPGQGEPELSVMMSLRPKGGLRVRVTPRTPALVGAGV